MVSYIKGTTQHLKMFLTNPSDSLFSIWKYSVIWDTNGIYVCLKAFAQG